MLVRRVRPSDAPSFRAVRLESLRADPGAFESTWEREAAYPNDRWAEWSERGAAGKSSATFVAESTDGRLVGMAGAFSEENAFMLWGMWVAPEERGRGVGRRLLAMVLEWAEVAGPSMAIRLEVNPEQAAAVRMYENFGFRFTGRSRPLGHPPPAVAKEMRRDARSSPSSSDHESGGRP